MNLIITGHHFDLSKKDKHFITEKTNTKLAHFISRLHNISIIVEQRKYLIHSECTVTSDFGGFFSSSIDEKMESSIDQTLSKILHEIKKKHDKIVSHHQKL